MERFEGSFESMFSAEHEGTLEDDFRFELERLEYTTTNELTRFLASKLREKYDLKAQVKAMDEYADDVTIYQHLKRLGIFIVVHTKAKESITLNDTGFQLNEGDEIIDLHLPPLEDSAKLAGQARESFALLANYLHQHSQTMHPKYILGSTYEALARLATRFGFETADIPIPDDLQQAIERVYSKTNRARAGRSMGSIQLVHQPTDSFLKRFATNSSI